MVIIITYQYLPTIILFLVNLICITATLAEAQAKLPRAAINSDLSTEDEVIKRGKKKLSSDELRSSNNAPPLYKDVCSISWFLNTSRFFFIKF